MAVGPLGTAWWYWQFLPVPNLGNWISIVRRCQQRIPAEQLQVETFLILLALKAWSVLLSHFMSVPHWSGHVLRLAFAGALSRPNNSDSRQPRESTNHTGARFHQEMGCRKL